jgi:hypothetical protein
MHRVTGARCRRVTYGFGYLELLGGWAGGEGAKERPKALDCPSLGGPGGPGNFAKRWGVGTMPPTFWQCSPSSRGRIDSNVGRLSVLFSRLEYKPNYTIRNLP